MGVRVIEKARKEPMDKWYIVQNPTKSCLSLDIWLNQEAELRGVVISRSLSEAGLERIVTGREML